MASLATKYKFVVFVTVMEWKASSIKIIFLSPTRFDRFCFTKPVWQVFASSQRSCQHQSSFPHFFRSKKCDFLLPNVFRIAFLNRILKLRFFLAKKLRLVEKSCVSNLL